MSESGKGGKSIGINDLKYLLCISDSKCSFSGSLCVYVAVHVSSKYLYANVHSIFFIFSFDSASPIKIEFHSSLSIQFKWHTNEHTHLQFVLQIHTQWEKQPFTNCNALFDTNKFYAHSSLTVLLHLQDIF